MLFKPSAPQKRLCAKVLRDDARENNVGIGWRKSAKRVGIVRGRSIRRGGPKGSFLLRSGVGLGCRRGTVGQKLLGASATPFPWRKPKQERKGCESKSLRKEA